MVGIDLGIKNFIITSNGNVFENQHFKKSEYKKIKKLQRQLSKKVKGSNNRNKARIKLAKVYKTITDCKSNYLHKISNILIDENQVICMEDLNVKGMLKNHKLADSISEMNFREFRRILQYKSLWYNRRLVFIDRYYPSSKRCNHCGYINKSLKLSDRQWTCPDCGSIIDRDYNAALNILEEGQRIISCNVNPIYMDKHSEMNLKSSCRLKQVVKN
jgi:putative transposase